MYANVLNGYPILFSITPSVALPGKPLEIIGEELQSVTSLQFKNDYDTVTVIPTYVDELNCLSPAIYGTLRVKAYDANRESNEITFTCLDPLLFDLRIDPILLEGRIGAAFYIRGTNLIQVSEVWFGTLRASYKILSTHLIRVIIPSTPACTLTLDTPYSRYELGIFTPIVSQLLTSSLTGYIGQNLTIRGTRLEVVAVQFARRVQGAVFVDAFLVSSASTEVVVQVPYGYDSQTIYLYDLQRNTLTLDFEYSTEIQPLIPVFLEYRDTSGITQDSNQRLYRWTPTQVDYPSGSYTGTIDQVVVDTNTLYVSNQTTQIIRYRTDSRVALRPFVAPTPIQRLFLNSPSLYSTSGTTLYVWDITCGRYQTYLLPRVYVGLAFWNRQIYGTDGVQVYQLMLSATVTETLFPIEGIVGPIQQLLVVHERLFVLSNNLLQYNLMGGVEKIWNVSYACMAYSDVSLLLSTHRQIDQLVLPPAIQNGVQWSECSPTTGTQDTLIKLAGENVDQITAILFDQVPATIVFSTRSTLFFRAPKGVGLPQIEILDSSYTRIPHAFSFEYENTECTLSLPREGLVGSPIYLFGTHLDQVTHVYLGGFLLDFVLVEKNTLRVLAPDSTGTLLFTLIDQDKNVLSGQTFTYKPLYSSICFPGHTLVYADQGAIEIRNLIAGIHTIYGRPILAITVTYYIEDTMVQFEPGALGPNLPERTTVMTQKHKIFVHGNMVEAYRLVGPGITSIPYEGYRVYNVLLETEGRMNVQGLICETLDPSNPIASQFLFHSVLDVIS